MAGDGPPIGPPRPSSRVSSPPGIDQGPRPPWVRNGRHVRGLVEEPEPLPFVAGLAEVLGVDEQLLDPLGLIGRIVRQWDQGHILRSRRGSPPEATGPPRVSAFGLLPPSMPRAGHTARSSARVQLVGLGRGSRIRFQASRDFASGTSTRFWLLHTPGTMRASARRRDLVESSMREDVGRSSSAKEESKAFSRRSRPRRKLPPWATLPPARRVRCPLNRHYRHRSLAEVSTGPSFGPVLPFPCRA